MKRSGIITMAIVLVILGCQHQSGPPVQSTDLCDTKIIKECLSCSPYIERLKIASIVTDNMKFTEIKRCADATLSASLKDVKYADAAFKGCISSNLKLDEKTRDNILKQIEEAKVQEKEYDAWFKCYSKIVGAKPVVVLMDSHVTDVVYCKHTQEIGGSNADDIVYLIKDLPISINTVATNLEWQDDQRVKNMDPALVVLHASAFYKDTKAMEGNTRLINFLDNMKNTNSKILVYTRGLPDQPEKDVIIRWEKIKRKMMDPELVKNAELFVMPKGHGSCFTDPDIGVPFKKKITDMLGLK